MSGFLRWLTGKKQEPLTPAEIAIEINNRQAKIDIEVNKYISELSDHIQKSCENIGTCKLSFVQSNGDKEIRLTVSIPKDGEILYFQFTRAKTFFMLHLVNAKTQEWEELWTQGYKPISKIKNEIVQAIGEIYSEYLYA